ncbi:hypothetical protein XELAEV_18035574mg [Xenopus laevis]|uniref:Uncharacterized protein n=1 Tax=Xenopus laevis TaxID=8355 RepID=A0A974CFW2_XENLA|nr:hypothetical protein XELAEV_18035574mg [Xenopus laevis]
MKVTFFSLCGHFLPHYPSFIIAGSCRSVWAGSHKLCVWGLDCLHVQVAEYSIAHNILLCDLQINKILPGPRNLETSIHLPVCQKTLMINKQQHKHSFFLSIFLFALHILNVP